MIGSESVPILSTGPTVDDRSKALAALAMHEHFAYLDGLHGLASVAVANFHFPSAYVPGMMPDQTLTPWRGTDTPPALLYNGSLAVSIFFVLSGFVIAGSTVKRRIPLPLIIALRFLRLVLPMLGGTLFAWVLRSFPGAVATLASLIPHA